MNGREGAARNTAESTRVTRELAGKSRGRCKKRRDEPEAAMRPEIMGSNPTINASQRP